MAPTTSSKGKALKPGGGKASAAPRSRNTTPLPNARPSVEPPSGSTATYFEKPLSSALKRCSSTMEDILETGGNGTIPSGSALIKMRDQVEKTVLKSIETRCTQAEAALRTLHGLRKNRAPRERKEDKDDDRKHKLKKPGKKHDEDSKHPPAVGAHGVARQDGVEAREDSNMSSPTSQEPAAAADAPQDAASPSGSDVSHQPAPAPAVPQYQTFGEDPVKFDDPTVYHIREVTPGMTDEEKKEIYSVAVFPPSNLHDKIAGLPPDKDFSNAKPATQVNAGVFANYVEPYIRPLTEEDVAFLRERGDRTGPFVLPRRGQRHYKAIWAEEDGAMHIDSNVERSTAHVPRGAAEDLVDEVLETEQVSAGPLVSRLLATLRPEGRGAQTNDTNNLNSDAMDIDEGAGAPVDTTNTNTLPAATQLPDFTGRLPQPPTPHTDYASLEDRMLMELKHYGLLSEPDTETQTYDYHFDDEVAQRLRFLQEELRKQSIVNGARKQRLLELTEERIAQQEYNTIADDLDNQLNAAYLKRNRNIGKGKKQNKRPGGAGGGSHAVANAGISRPGVGEPIRTLMERRIQWISTIGPVVNFGKTGLPEETVFPEEKMRELESREVEIWNTEAEE
ncbi:Transcriptional regulator [Curvularia kusanoi]|uniref:Transcriptional regulator n=1 Tax=Curvularia kusanoi TaxID=90978 RepID=A0A9P4TEC5_CURKU|nr:Transcriptional regulator [Curvularia kusanoi]